MVKQVPIQGVRVVFVTPSDVSFNLALHERYLKDVSTRKATQTRTLPLQQIAVEFVHASVDAASSAHDVAAKLLNQAA